NRSMNSYRERLWPSPLLLIALLLIIPATLLVFLPINQLVGLFVAVALYAASAGVLLARSPLITVGTDGITVGAAHLPSDVIGEVTWFDDAEGTAERGVRLDARAWVVIRGGISAVVRIELRDPADPAPYWLIATRRPAGLAEAIDA